MKSWKTTGAGIAGIIGMLGTAVSAMLDGNPATVPQWEIVIPAVIGMAGLLFARDNNVSSEQAGANDHTPKPKE